MTGSMILCASNDEQVLSDVRGVLRGRPDAWDVHFAGTAAEALNVLERAPVDALVARPGMAGGDGRSLLEYTHTHYPAVARVVLADRVGSGVQVDTVGGADQALSKPCTPETLAAALTLVLEVRDLVQSPSLRALFGSQNALAKPPEVYAQLVQLSQDPNSTTEDVVALLERDVGLTAEVLRLVNSALYGQSSTVKSLQRAVVLLGLDTLKALAIAGEVFRPGASPLPAGLDPAGLAERAVRASRTAQLVARRERWDTETISEVSLSALLSEVGLLVLAAAHPQQWAHLVEFAEQMPAGHAQQEAFGCTVGRASACLLGLWGFPAGAVAATAPQPLEMSDPDVVASAAPAALAVAFAHRKALGQAEAHLFARSTYLSDRRLERWQSVS